MCVFTDQILPLWAYTPYGVTRIYITAILSMIADPNRHKDTRAPHQYLLSTRIHDLVTMCTSYAQYSMKPTYAYLTTLIDVLNILRMFLIMEDTV